MSKWPNQKNVDSFYGNPRGKNGGPNLAWQKENITRVLAPWKMFTAWDHAPITKGVTINKKCADSLTKIFERIWIESNKDQSVIDEWGMSLYAGGYNFRMMRGSNQLSMHSW